MSRLDQIRAELQTEYDAKRKELDEIGDALARVGGTAEAAAPLLATMPGMVGGSPLNTMPFVLSPTPKASLSDPERAPQRKRRPPLELADRIDALLRASRSGLRVRDIARKLREPSKIVSSTMKKYRSWGGWEHTNEGRQSIWFLPCVPMIDPALKPGLTLVELVQGALRRAARPVSLMDIAKEIKRSKGAVGTVLPTGKVPGVGRFADPTDNRFHQQYLYYLVGSKADPATGGKTAVAS